MTLEALAKNELSVKLTCCFLMCERLLGIGWMFLLLKKTFLASAGLRCFVLLFVGFIVAEVRGANLAELKFSFFGSHSNSSSILRHRLCGRQH